MLFEYNSIKAYIYFIFTKILKISKYLSTPHK